MSFSVFLRCAFAGCLSLAPLHLPGVATGGGAARPPNVILILADDMAVGDVAAFNGGRTRTPNIDRLIADGVWFNAAYSASAVCAPARAALLTGRAPHRTGVVTLNLNKYPELTRLHLDEVTMADVFAANGYATGLIGKWHIGLGEAYHPLQRGFQEYAGFSGSDDVGYFRYMFDEQGKRSEVSDPYLTDNLSARAVAFVRRHRDHPFFLHLAHYAPHRPLEAPADAVAAYRARGFDKNTATIYAMIEIMDRGIGELLAELDRLDLRRNTLVLFASDNGPDPVTGTRFNLNLRGTKYQIYEGGIRVPFVANWPGRLPPGVRNAVVHFTDVYPTLAEIAGLKLPARQKPLDGVSLVPVLFGGVDRIDVPRFWQWNRAVPNYTHNAAMREGPWKLVRPYVTRNDNPPDSKEAPVLYDLGADPIEAVDVSAQHPERFQKMQAALARWSAEVERERTRSPAAPR